MPLRDRELTTTPPNLASLQEISGPAVIAMLLAAGIIVVDAAVGGQPVFIGLLAIPPVIAAMSASLPETAVVAVFCLVLAVLSPFWGGFGDGQRWVSATVVVAGAVCGIWVAGLRARLNREQAASELLSEAGALMEDALDQKQRSMHLATLAVPTLGDVAIVDVVAADGSIERLAAQSGGSEVAEVFARLRQDSPIDPHGPHPVAEVIRTGRAKHLDRLGDEEMDRITTRQNERELLRRYPFRSCIVLPLGA